MRLAITEIQFQTMAHGTEFVPVGLVQVAPGGGGVSRGEIRLIRLDALDERGREAAQPIGMRQALAQLLHPAQIDDQHLVHMQAQGGHGRGRRDERVAVAVAAYPRSETQQSAGDGYVRRAITRGVDALDGLFQVAVGLRHGIEQTLAEVKQAVADFLLDGRFVQAYLVGFPQDLYLLLQILDDVGAFFARQPPVGASRWSGIGGAMPT